MKNSVWTVLGILVIILLMGSFPIRDYFGNAALAEAFKIAGFTLLLVMVCLYGFQNRK